MFLIPPLLALVTVLVWRFAPPAAGFIASVNALVVAGLVGWRFPHAARVGLPALGLLAALVTILRLMPGDAVWPCSVHCDGGGAYHALAGVDVLWGALIAYALFTAGCLREHDRERLSPPLAVLGWALVGTSLYFLHLSLRLNLACSHCLAVHTAVLAMAPALARSLRPLPAGIAALFTALALHAAFHPGIRSDGVDPEITRPEAFSVESLTPPERLVYAEADAARRDGNAKAPRVVTIIVDLQCPTCARLHGPLLDALGPAITDGRLEVITRLLVRRSDPQSLVLARWAYASAARGRSWWQLYLGGMLGTPHGLDDRALRQRVAELSDPLLLDAAIDAHQSAIDRLLAEDAQALIDLAASPRTPQVIVTDRGRTQAVERWEGDLPIDEIALWVNR